MIGLEKTIISLDICKITMPIDLYKAYGEYHYEILKNENPYPEGMYSVTELLASAQIINH